jgi:hypothetical protein
LAQSNGPATAKQDIRAGIEVKRSEPVDCRHRTLFSSLASSDVRPSLRNARFAQAFDEALQKVGIN